MIKITALYIILLTGQSLNGEPFERQYVVDHRIIEDSVIPWPNMVEAERQMSVVGNVEVSSKRSGHCEMTSRPIQIGYKTTYDVKSDGRLEFTYYEADNLKREPTQLYTCSGHKVSFDTREYSQAVTLEEGETRNYTIDQNLRLKIHRVPYQQIEQP